MFEAGSNLLSARSSETWVRIDETERSTKAMKVVKELELMARASAFVTERDLTVQTEAIGEIMAAAMASSC